LRHEVDYWTKKWGCTEAQLRAAVAATGSIMADKIEAPLDSDQKQVRLISNPFRLSPLPGEFPILPFMLMPAITPAESGSKNTAIA